MKLLRTPLIVEWNALHFRTQKFSYFSVSTCGATNYRYPMGRLRVKFNKNDHSFGCVCEPSLQACVHITIVKWFILQVHGPLVFGQRTVIESAWNENEISSNSSVPEQCIDQEEEKD